MVCIKVRLAGEELCGKGILVETEVDMSQPKALAAEDTNNVLGCINRSQWIVAVIMHSTKHFLDCIWSTMPSFGAPYTERMLISWSKFSKEP